MLIRLNVIGKNDTGWWQVQSARDQKIGWIQPNLLSDIPIIPKSYYVTVDSLPLRDAPSEDIVSRKLLVMGMRLRSWRKRMVGGG